MPPKRLHTGTPVPTTFPDRVTLMGDTNHGDIEGMRTFRDTLRNFAAQGGRHVVMEADGVYGRIFQMIKNGQATMDDFKDVMDVSSFVPDHQRKEGQTIFQDIMRIALDNKMGFHAVDQPPDEAIKKYPEIQRMIVEANRGNAQPFFDKMRDPAFAAQFAEYNMLFQTQRVANDRVVANTINGLTMNGDRALVMYGADHLPRLATHLGVQNVQGYFMINPNTPQGRAEDERLKSLPLHQERRGALNGPSYANLEASQGGAQLWAQASMTASRADVPARLPEAAHDNGIATQAATRVAALDVPPPAQTQHAQVTPPAKPNALPSVPV